MCVLVPVAIERTDVSVAVRGFQFNLVQFSSVEASHRFSWWGEKTRKNKQTKGTASMRERNTDAGREKKLSNSYLRDCSEEGGSKTGKGRVVESRLFLQSLPFTPYVYALIILE